jgi:hypothetical protein
MVPMVSRTPRGPGQRSLLHVKLALAAVGVGTWLYGYHADDGRVRWLGIAFLGVAFLLRFLGGKDAEPPAD